ncbi:MAG: DEAD/DEAH box helicase [Bacteroidales bacterium]|nr:DEAD/DEAH box helicase [Bacteroidales bacterium]
MKTQKGTGKKKKTEKDKKKAEVRYKVSHLVKPIDMTLEQWQVALRRQAAEKETFEIAQPRDRENPGYFTIKKAIFKKISIKDDRKGLKPKFLGYGPTYKVVYRGDNSQWNYCSCMDFCTTGLGTCKHIEAVKLWLDFNKKRPSRALPSASSMYIDYKDDRKIKLRIGSDERERIAALAKDVFDDTGDLLPVPEHKILDFIRQAKELSPTFRCYPDVMEQLSAKRRKKYLQALAQQIDDPMLDSLLKTHLYPYQKEGIRFALRHGRSIIADEMGLGKTVQAIGTAELLRKSQLITSVLIVCPTSLKYQWKYEIEKFTASKVTVVEGNALKRKAIYDSDDAFYKIVSYNAMANDVKAHGSLSTDMLIMDEVQRLKNWETQMAKAARNIRSDYAVILSGTPLENKLEELYSIVELVDQHYLGPYYKFRDEHIVTDGAGMTIGYKNLNTIGDKLKEILIRRRKSEVALQMPARQDKTLYVPMTKEQAEMHDEFEYQVGRIVTKWRNYGFLSELDRQRLMLFLSQMRMVANSTYILDQKSRHDTKIDELVNILTEIFENGDEKVVIFSGWERMTRLVCAELDKLGVRYSNLNGSVPSAKRRNLVKDFTDDPECRVFVSTDAGSTGLNLQAGSIIINLELPWNPAVLEQRIGRIYRLGQKRNIQVINMVSVDSIEKQIETKIGFKSALFAGILDQGDDMVMLPDKKKLDELMETLGRVVDEKEKEPKADTHPEEEETEMESGSEETTEEQEDIIDAEEEIVEPEVEIVEPEDHAEIREETMEAISTSNEAPTDEKVVITSETSEKPSADKDTKAEEREEAGHEKVTTNPERLVSQGISFFTGLASVLQSPEKTQALVDTVVKTDPTTGQTTLQIPVPDKAVVTGFLTLLGKMLASSK